MEIVHLKIVRMILIGGEKTGSEWNSKLQKDWEKERPQVFVNEQNPQLKQKWRFEEAFFYYSVAIGSVLTQVQATSKLYHSYDRRCVSEAGFGSKIPQSRN